MEKLFLAQFSGIDVVVWNGIITTFNVIKELIEDDDEIRLANDEERKRYSEQKK